MSVIIFEEQLDLYNIVGGYANNSLEKMEQYLSTAVDEYLVHVMSRAQWAKFLVDYGSYPTYTVTMNAIALGKIRKVLANFAYYLFASEGGITLSDSGLQRVDNEEVKSAYQWQTLEFKRNAWAKSWTALSELAIYLETNKGIYTDYASSDERKAYRSNSIVTLAEMNAVRGVEGYDTVIKLFPFFSKIENGLMASNITPELMAVIKDGILNNNLSADNLVLLPYIQNVVGNLAIADATKLLPFEIGSKGASVSTIKAVYRNQVEIDTFHKMLSNLVKDCVEVGRSSMTQLRDFLDANASASKYAEYFSSDKYTAPGDESDLDALINQSRTGKTFLF